MAAFVMNENAAQFVQRFDNLDTRLALLAHGKAFLEQFSCAYQISTHPGALTGESRASRLKRQQVAQLCCRDSLPGRSQLTPMCLTEPEFANSGDDPNGQLRRVIERTRQCGAEIIMLSLDAFRPDRIFRAAAVCLSVFSKAGEIFGVGAIGFCVGAGFMQLVQTKFADGL